MPVQPLQDVPAGADIFLDTNVLLYGMTAQSRSAQQLLERCSTEEVTGITSFDVLAEATHRLMLIEAQNKGVFPNTPPCAACGLVRDKGVRFLTAHPEQVRVLTDYWQYVVRMLDLNVLWLPAEERIHRSANIERQRFGLMTNDSLIVATMREYGVRNIATGDGQFVAIPDIAVFAPNDINH